MAKSSTTYSAVRWFITSILVLHLWSCASDSNNTDPTVGGNGTGTGSGIRPNSGHIELGPLINATVGLFDIADIDTQLCVATTGNNLTADPLSLDYPGNFQFSADCLVSAEGIYMVKSGGGIDVDPDDDGVFVSSIEEGTPVLGEFRAVVTGHQLQNQLDWRVTALTETAFRSAEYLLDANISSAEVTTIMDQLAPLFLQSDQDNDGDIDADDIILWQPALKLSELTEHKKTRWLTEDIHAALNSNVPAASVLETYPVDWHFDTRAKATRILGDENTIFVATETALLILQVDENGLVHFASALATGWVYDIAIHEDVLAIALGDQGIQLVSVEDKDHPEIVFSSATPAHRLASSDDGIYFVNQDTSTFWQRQLGVLRKDSGIYAESIVWQSTQDFASSILSGFTIIDQSAYLVTISLHASIITVLNFDSTGNIESSDTIVYPYGYAPILDIARQEDTLYLAIGQISLLGEASLLPYLVSYDINSHSFTDWGEQFRPLAIHTLNDAVLILEPDKLIETDNDWNIRRSYPLPDLLDNSRFAAIDAVLLYFFDQDAIKEVLQILDEAYSFSRRFDSLRGQAVIAAGRYGLLGQRISD